MNSETTTDMHPAERRKARRRAKDRPVPVRVADGGVTYYGRPAVKHAPWTWTVGAYIFVGGVAGGAQVIAGAARLGQGGEARGVVRRARLIGFGGAVVGAGLLIYDLKTPHRFYNMLRIYRPTSPMSLGSYVLVAFGAATAVGALSEVVGTSGGAGRALRVIADVAQVPAFISGALLSTYTASLLASTSTPLWAAAASPLGGHFGASALSSGAAALSLWSRLAGDEKAATSLDGVAVLCAAADAVFTRMGEERIRAHGVLYGSVEGSDDPAPTSSVAFALGCVLPVASYLATRALGRRMRGLSVAASLGTLVGAMIAKSSIVEAGKSSADRPRDYFRLTKDGVTARIGAPELSHE